MANEIDNLLLEQLQAIRVRVEDAAAKLKRRTALLSGRLAHLIGQYAFLSHRIDRIDTCFEQIARRLDLVEA